MLATPDLLWPDQSLPAAFRSCTGSPYQRQNSALARSWPRRRRIAPQPFPSRVWRA